MVDVDEQAHDTEGRATEPEAGLGGPGLTRARGRRTPGPAASAGTVRADRPPHAEGDQRPHRAACLRRRRRHQGRPGRHLHVPHQQGHHRGDRPQDADRPLLPAPPTTTRSPATGPRSTQPRTTPPIVAQGDQDTIAAGLHLADGKYLISVLADGYKLDGAHFTMPIDDAAPVPVPLQPMPLPDSTVKGQVFEDMAPTNGAYDAGDRPLAGFRRPPQRRPRRGQHGRLRQPAVHDVRRRGPGHPRDPARRARRRHGSRWSTQIGGQCVSDADGIVTYPHMGTNRYTQYVTPPPDGRSGQVDPDHHARGQPRLGQLGDGGLDRLRHRVRAGRRGRCPRRCSATRPDEERAAAGRRRRRPHHRSGDAHPALRAPEGRRSSTSTTASPAPRCSARSRTRWLSLSDLENGDQAVWVGQADADGRFDISRRPRRRLHADLVGRAAEQPAGVPATSPSPADGSRRWARCR